jgi:hypothetical protein
MACQAKEWQIQGVVIGEGIISAHDDAGFTLTTAWFRNMGKKPF